MTVVSEKPSFAKQEVDYLNIDSTHTVCQLLRYVLGSGVAAEHPRSGASEHAHGNNPTVFQINHARILEPKAGDRLITYQGDRLFPTVSVIDNTGTVETRYVRRRHWSFLG